MRHYNPLARPVRSATASHAEIFSAALRGERCTVLGLTDGAIPMPVERWSAAADESDEVVLDHCTGTTIDIGCGPGRLTLALAIRGLCALGIDLVPEAVAQSRARGASAIVRDVFEQVPGEGRWDCGLLADGNIGIGGDPAALLTRVRGLIHQRGKVIVDLARPGIGLVTRNIRLQVAGMRSEPFTWSVVSPEALPALAAQAGLEITGLHEHESRWFAELGPGSLS